MSTQVQYRRGTGAQNDAFTGALAEITVDTTAWTLRIHDGTTAGGGGNLATVAYVDNAISSLSADSISNGTSIVKVASSGGNIFANVGGTTIINLASTQIDVTGNIIPTANVTYNLGSDTARFNDLYLANSTIYLGNAQISANATALSFTNPSGAITVFEGSTPDITVSSITKTGSNGAGNIGQSDNSFNTVFAKSTSAQYADVAERYLADADYPVGTVLVFGGDQEVTQSQIDHSTAIAGTVSDRPAYVMNTGLEGDHVVSVALLGRVPVRVVGTVRPGDLLVASELPGIATSLIKDRYAPGCVIGKALESYDSQREGVIEAVVGRL